MPDNLFTLFGRGYRLAVNESHTALCPEDLCGGGPDEGIDQRMVDLVDDLSIVSAHQLLPDSLDAGLPSVTQTFEDFGEEGAEETGVPAGADARTDAGPDPARRPLLRRGTRYDDRLEPFESLLPAIDGGDRSLYFVHLNLPHVPWSFLPDGSRYELPAVEPFGFDPEEQDRWPRSASIVRHGQQRHLLQVGLVDRLLGGLIDRLRAEGIWDRALVAVLADHGGSFLPGAYRRVATERNLPTIANVPMLVKAPGQRRGRIVDARMRTIDLLPTIARELGMRLPFEVEGEPAPRSGRPSGRLTVESRRGEPVSAPLRLLVRARDRIAHSQAKALRAGRGWAALYRSGPHAELIGTPVGELQLAAGSAGELQLDGGPGHLTLTSHAGVVPALVSGSLSGSVEPGTPVAVAVNGRVAAMGTSYADGEGTRMVAMVPPGVYRIGENGLSAFALLPGGRLQRIDDRPQRNDGPV